MYFSTGMVWEVKPSCVCFTMFLRKKKKAVHVTTYHVGCGQDIPDQRPRRPQWRGSWVESAFRR